MQEESTTHLNQILNQNTKISDLDEFMSQYQKDLPDTSFFSSYIADHPAVTCSLIANNCKGLISKSYVYEVLSGKKINPSRDIVLILCISAHMDRTAIRRCLEIYGHRDLYPKDARDIVILIYVNNGNFDINQINDALFERSLPILGKLQ